MMKRALAAIVFALALGTLAFGQSAGGGISVFVPETLYRYGKGTVAFEQGLSTAIGFGKIISLPVGFAYHSTDGFTVEHADLKRVEGPAFYGDSIIPYAMLKAKIPWGPCTWKPSAAEPWRGRSP
jgi:hypothetical protein